MTPAVLLLSLVGLDQDECWTDWPHATSGDRPRIKMGGKEHEASRLLCELAHGEPFRGAQAAHNCGNGACLNPRHLRWATCRENQQDKVKHGTAPAGERNPNCRLTRAQAAEIKRRCLNGETTLALAAAFGVSSAQVSRIARGVSWAGLDVEELDARED